MADDEAEYEFWGHMSTVYYILQKKCEWSREGSVRPKFWDLALSRAIANAIGWASR